MAYDRSYWKDHVTDQSGEVIQQGTLLDQQHFNNMELGISDMTLAGAIMQFKAVQDGYNYADEINNAEAERCLIRGGNWNDGGGAGVFSSHLSIPRSNAYGSVGGRSAFYE